MVPASPEKDVGYCIGAGAKPTVDAKYETVHGPRETAYSGSVQLSSKQRLLKYAAEKLGADELAKRLKVSEDDLLRWMEGRGEIPARKTLALADLVIKLGTA